MFTFKNYRADESLENIKNIFINMDHEPEWRFKILGSPTIDVVLRRPSKKDPNYFITYLSTDAIYQAFEKILEKRHFCNVTMQRAEGYKSCCSELILAEYDILKNTI
jgi:hypothetical protein